MSSGIIEAYWSDSDQAWIVKPPSLGWTRLHGTWAKTETPKALLLAVRRQVGHCTVQGAHVLITSAPEPKGSAGP